MGYRPAVLARVPPPELHGQHALPRRSCRADPEPAPPQRKCIHATLRAAHGDFPVSGATAGAWKFDRANCGGVMKRRAFTMVELLVVVGVIALLIAMLMPALRRARQQAQAVQCASNLRQVHSAFAMYANEFKGHFPFPMYYQDFLGERL